MITARLGTWDTEIVEREFDSADDVMMEFLRMSAAAAIRKKAARDAKKDDDGEVAA